MEKENKNQEQSKPEEKKSRKQEEKPKKTTAIVNATDLRISTKYSTAICKMIRNHKIENAVKMLEQVLSFKRPVKTNKMEVGHKSGRGIMAGKYPINAVKEFIRLLKQLQANAIANELEIENYGIFCKADQASRPYRRRGMRFKRTHVTLKLMPIKKKGERKK